MTTEEGSRTWVDLEEFIHSQGIEAEIIAYSSETPTVQAAADVVGCAPAQIVKSLLFLVDQQPVLAISPGQLKIDRRKIASHFGVGRKRVRLADADEVQEQTGYPVGAVPPFGLKKPVPALLDPAVLDYETVYAGGGSSDRLLRIPSSELMRITAATMVSLQSIDD
jgi:Cys-tRNA(Pro) deacylase